VGFGPEMPLSCFTIAFGSSPDLSARDINLLIASDWAAALPPAFPIAVKTSHSPFSSWLIVIYKVPSPVRILRVIPFVSIGRNLGVLSLDKSAAI